jgi:uncharacterized protein YdaU (DUF1376 family)
MSKITDTWMPLNLGKWETNTGHLSNEHIGAYLRLCIWYWTNGPLPDDDDQLASIIRDNRRWRSIRPKIEKFFIVGGGVWTHPFLDGELAKAREIGAKRGISGKEGAARRWGKVVPLKAIE